MSGWIWTTVCAVSHCLVLFLSWSVGFVNIDIDTDKYTIFGTFSFMKAGYKQPNFMWRQLQY